MRKLKHLPLEAWRASIHIALPSLDHVCSQRGPPEGTKRAAERVFPTADARVLLAHQTEIPRRVG